MPQNIKGFSRFKYDLGGIEHTVYKTGHGPGVLVMHELPGMAKPCVSFAQRIASSGFTVYLPHFFGALNKDFSNLDTSLNTIHICISREFHIFTSGKTSPLVQWLRGLSRLVHQECGGPGIGAVGMCLTGGFAIPLLVESPLVAPVVSQPSLPFGTSLKTKRDIGCSRGDLDQAKQRCLNEDIKLLCFRFSEDNIAPAEKFETLAEEFGEKAILTTIDSKPGNRHNIRKKAHAVFTFDYNHKNGHPTRDAFDSIIAYYKEKLIVKNV